MDQVPTWCLCGCGGGNARRRRSLYEDVKVFACGRRSLVRNGHFDMNALGGIR